MNHYRELAKLYYEQAATYHKRIYRKKTGVGQVLEKISSYYDVYQELLKRVRRDYFDFVHGVKDQVFQSFQNEVRTYEKQIRQKTAMDQFLDFYGQWLETKNPGLEKDIVRLAGELEQLDPDFHFDVNRHLNQGGWSDERKCA
jgi:hypothetical protein